MSTYMACSPGLLRDVSNLGGSQANFTLGPPPPRSLARLASDPLLSGVSHVVVDEVHERSLQGDVLMALLQRIAAARNKAADAAAAAAAAATTGGRHQQQQHHGPQRLKVILMSATLDANIYRFVTCNCHL